MRDQVFISYSHRDARWLERLQVYLAPLGRRGRIRRWDDTLITPVQQWERETAACRAIPSYPTAIGPALPVTAAPACGAWATAGRFQPGQAAVLRPGASSALPSHRL